MAAVNDAVLRLQGWSDAQIAAENAWHDKSNAISAKRLEITRQRERVERLVAELEALNFELGRLDGTRRKQTGA